MPFKTAYGVSNAEVADFVKSNEVVRTWCSKFRSAPREGWLSGSRLGKARILCRFFNWLRIVKDVDLSPEELLERHRQLRLRESSTIQERQWLLNLVLKHTRDNPDFSEYADRTKYRIFTCIKSFVDRYEVPLTIAKNIYGKKRKKKNHRKQIDLNEAKKILGKMSQRNRTICVIMLQGGIEIGGVLNKLNYMWHSQVKPQLDEGRSRLKIEFDERKANGTWYFTFISRDGTHELRKWLLERRRIVEKLLADSRKIDQSIVDGEPIFITRYGTPLRPHQFIKNFHRMMNGKVTTHMFRKLFFSEATVPDRGIDPRIVKFFMGHITSMDDEGGIYGRNPEIHGELFEREYAKLEPYINIYSGVQAEPLTEEDREWLKFTILLRETLEKSPNKREKFLNLLNKL